MGRGIPAMELLAAAQVFLVALSIGFARFYGFTYTFPMFAWVKATGTMRFAFAVGLGMPSVGLVYASIVGGGAPSPWIWSVLVAKEILIGAIIGILLGIPFWAIQGVGDAIDVYRGASAANLLDPVNAQETTISGTFLGLLGLAFFVSFDGIPQLIDLILRSQEAWPALALTPPFEMDRARVLGGVAVQGVMLAFVIAAPLFIAMLLIDVTLIFSVRAARSIQIYDLAQAGRGFMLLMVLPVFVVLFANHFSEQSRGLIRLARDAFAALVR